MQKLIIAVLALTIANVSFGAKFYNINTKQSADVLPAITVDGKFFQSPSLKEAYPFGWREYVPCPAAQAGTVIATAEPVQSKDDPAKIEWIITTKTDAQVAIDQAAADKAQADAQAERDAVRAAEREAITKAFTDSKQAEAIGALFDLMRPRW